MQPKTKTILVPIDLHFISEKITSCATKTGKIAENLSVLFTIIQLNAIDVEVLWLIPAIFQPSKMKIVLGQF